MGGLPAVSFHARRHDFASEIFAVIQETFAADE
jgi:hypothetical protein